MATTAHLDWFTGAWDGLAERAAALACQEDLQVIIRLEAELITARLHAARGDRDQAGDLLRAVFSETSRRRAVYDSVEPAAALARLALAANRLDDALAVTAELISIVAGKGIWLWAAELAPARADALAAAGRLSEAEELVTVFAQGLRGRDAPAPRAGLAVCRAILAEARGERAPAAALFARAAAAWQALPRPYDALLARERQAACLLAAGRPEAGLHLLRDVHQGLSRLGATADESRVAGVLREHGMAVPQVWRGGRRGYGSQLSPRERDVVRLVIVGHTNKEIASILFRSPRTVEGQLKSAMRKLGVTSRTALAVAALDKAAGAGQSGDGDRSPAPGGRRLTRQIQKIG